MIATPGCPSCGAPLTGSAACPSCELPLYGPVAARLWEVDQQLAGLGAERQRLLAQLRAGEVGGAQPAPFQPVLQRPAGAPAPRHETSPVGVQNTLLTLGALLLAVAGIVFTAVTYRHLGVVGRAAVLLTLTGTAAWAPTLLRRRDLFASAESIGAVALVLAVLDANALRRAGVGDGIDGRTYACLATALLAVAAVGYARVVPLHTARIGAALLAQLPVPFLLARLEPAPWVVGVVLAAQAAVNLLLAARSPLPKAVRSVNLAAAGLLTFVAFVTSFADAVQEHRGGAFGLCAVAAVFALASWLAPAQPLRVLAALPVVPLLGGAAAAASWPDLTVPQRPLALLAVTLVALQASALLPRTQRLGPVVSALALGAVPLLMEVEAVTQAVVGPFTWLADPWTRSVGSARGAVGLDLVWSGSVVTLVVLLGAAVAALSAGVLLDRIAWAVPPAGVLVVLAGVALPLGLATSYRDALAVLLLVTAALVLGGWLAPPELRLPLLLSSSAIAVVTAAWSVADEDTTLTVLPIAALLVALAALRLPGGLTCLALLLGAGEVAAVGASQGLAADQVGALLLSATALATGLALVLRGRHCLGAEAAAIVLGLAAVLTSAGDPGWLSWTLAGCGLLALALSLRPDRREAGIVGALLLSASSWVRLADANVTAPEPYVLPLAVLALGLGALRRRTHPELRTVAAYGPGLGLALLPTLVQSLADDSPTRGVLLLVVCVALVLLGGRTRTQAPLLFGFAVAVIDALHLTWPYAAALPRWLPPALLGLLLVLLGATYEQRLRDLNRIRDRYAALR